MPQDPLLREIAQRTRTFSGATGVSLAKIAKLIGVEPSNFNAFIHGRIGLSAKPTTKLLQLLNLTKRQVEEKLAIKPVTIAHFQEGGKQLSETVRFSAPPPNAGWVAREGETDDPNSAGGDISTVRSIGSEGGDSSGDDLIDVLRQVDLFHKQAREAIAAWFANNAKATVNQDGSTGPARQISRPKTPGPRGDLL